MPKGPAVTDQNRGSPQRPGNREVDRVTFIFTREMEDLEAGLERGQCILSGVTQICPPGSFVSTPGGLAYGFRNMTMAIF